MSTTTTLPTQRMDGEAHDTLTLGATASAQGTALPLMARCRSLCEKSRAICQRSANLRQESAALLARCARLRSETAALLLDTTMLLSADARHGPELSRDDIASLPRSAC